MNDRFFIIAGNYDEAKNFMVNKIGDMWMEGNTSMSLSNFTYVSHWTKLKGLRNAHGWFVGTWRQRSDIKQIVEQLWLTQDFPKETLREIFREILQN